MRYSSGDRVRCLSTKHEKHARIPANTIQMMRAQSERIWLICVGQKRVMLPTCTTQRWIVER